ncbi:MAG: hypothetical protein QHD01_02910 [Bradyrhizobium sp.]|uniref:hypothetical protein n=1 Tax=Bradyrhizobium sp. TaxID=376 RepID=UPI0029AE6CDA|nr:hypothetical protein [Bradyrhizobium sp.]MDX3965535.1 hypothetical protein [Bradyrhizobium sp.]
MFLPAFGGFYGTHWEELLSLSEQLYAEMHAAELDGDDAPDEIELREMLSEFSDGSKHCTSIARSWCACFEEKMSKTLGFPLKLKFERLEMPLDYRLMTDRIVATVPMGTVKRLFDLSEKDRHRGLISNLSDWLTPMPHYTDLVKVWTGGKPLQRWDKNELFVLFDAFTDPEIDDEIFAEIGDGVATTAFEDSVDWKKFEAKLARRLDPRATRPRSASRERSKS